MNPPNFHGLDQSTVDKRQRLEGFNDLHTVTKRTFFVITQEIIKEPMFLLLLGAGLIYFILGEIHESIALMGFVVIVIVITIIQERRTEEALAALRNLASPRALVVRDNQLIRIAGQEVVRGDILIITEGDRIAADAQVLQSHSLVVDESILSGESVAVNKFNQDLVYAGTLVISGKGMIEVTQIGSQTQMGQISRSLSEIVEEKSPVQNEISLLTKRMAIVAVFLSVMLVLSYWLLVGGWLSGLLSGITLAMAILPQEFPVVLIVYFALGARQIASQRVLTRRLNAIETLGQTTVLCVDKTGTLTKNKMVLAGLLVDNTLLNIAELNGNVLPEMYHELLEYAVLASDINPFDPMEVSFHESLNTYLSNTEHIHQKKSLIQEYKISPELLAMTRLWVLSSVDEQIVATKGAPEAIIDLCHMPESKAKQILEQVTRMADLGWRVLAVAKAVHHKHTHIPSKQHDFDFEWVGLVGFHDPLREEVPVAVAECHRAGIRVIMMTGDHPHTARTIAHQAGIHHAQVLTGEELNHLDRNSLKQNLHTVNIFARVTPQQKLLIVETLKQQGEIVAMTGDGVNDAPALKSAHIGIAMGKRGTDVARESASLVLLEDDFMAIVSAIRLGRQIYINLRQALIYILISHIPVIGLSLLPILLNYPQILMPMHIAFLEILIGPLCSMAFEARISDQSSMSAPPRSTQEKLLQTSHIWITMIAGILTTVVIFLLYKGLIDRGIIVNKARTIAFIALISANISLLLSMQRDKLKTWLTAKSSLFIILLILVILTIICNFNVLIQLFAFQQLSIIEQFKTVGLGAVLFVLYILLWRLEKIKKKV
ncbi:MAG: HAD-IC family P-type ATPase [Betaproteobacteria bacterium]|nr:HAD-IC family P-type ATPase [Betaproteobacteria bacterium]